jgi:hypothetical protein
MRAAAEGVNDPLGDSNAVDDTVLGPVDYAIDCA